MTVDGQETLPPRLGLCLFDDVGALIAEHEVNEIPVARAFLLSLVALAAAGLFLIALDRGSQVSGRPRGKGLNHVDLAAQSWTGRDGVRLWDTCPKR